MPFLRALLTLLLLATPAWAQQTKTGPSTYFRPGISFIQGSCPWIPGVFRPNNIYADFTRQASDGTYGVACVLSQELPANQVFTRTGSGGTAFDASGNVVSFSGTALRTTNTGLTTWQPSTNSIRNNTMVGAVAGTPGTLPTNWSQSNNTGIVASVVGTGTEGGVNYIDLGFSGTASAGQTNVLMDTGTGISALTGQTWTSSDFLKIQTGTTTNIASIKLVIQENNSSGTAVAAGAGSAITVTGAALPSQRTNFVRTLSGGATVAALAPYLQVNLSAGAVGFTLRVGLPQAEQAAFPGPPILTSGTAVAIAQDGIALNPVYAGLVVPQGMGAIVANYTQAGILSATGAMASIDDGTFNNAIVLGPVANSSSRQGLVRTAGSNVAVLTGISPGIGISSKNALAFGVNDGGYAQDGVAAARSGGGSIGAFNAVHLGISGDGAATRAVSGTIQSIAILPYSANNTQLQQLTQ